MDELRWVLLVIGAGIVAGVYFYSRHQARPPAQSLRPREEIDPDLSEELDRLGQAISRDRSAEATGVSPESEDAADQDPSEEIETEPERIVTLYVQPREGGKFAGAKVLRAAGDAGLVFGRLNIFHRFHESEKRRIAVFSVANMTKPGDFDPDRPEAIECHGLCLFLTLPNPLSALDAWDAMLATGKRLADLLGGELMDESRSTLIRQRIAHIRDQMREYDRRKDLPRI
ncbi:MAG: cell division protein ZipA [Xanthomonadales bacterium]|nr:cell division protein ZipA [Xanthomonadales bacterium]